MKNRVGNKKSPPAEKKRKIPRISPASPKVIISTPKKLGLEDKIKKISDKVMNPKDGAIDPELAKAAKKLNG